MNQLPTGEGKRCYWAALGVKYAKPFSLLKTLTDKTVLRTILLTLVPYDEIIGLIPKWTALAVYDERGMLLETLRDDGGVDANGKETEVAFPWVSEPVGE